jgi:hypothetical protein
MSDQSTKLEREVSELRAEVRRLRRAIQGMVLIVCLGLVLLFPNLLDVGVFLGALILFGFLVSRQRRLIFRSLFTKRCADDVDA